MRRIPNNFTSGSKIPSNENLTDKSLKVFLNSRKCPLCGSQLDIVNSLTSKRGNSFACVQSSYHYGLSIINYSDPPVIDKENVIIVDLDKGYQYDITQEYFLLGQKFECSHIYISEIDAEGNRTFKPSKIVIFHKNLFDFSNTSRDKIINRIKTFLVFQ